MPMPVDNFSKHRGFWFALQVENRGFWFALRFSTPRKSPKTPLIPHFIEGSGSRYGQFFTKSPSR